MTKGRLGDRKGRLNVWGHERGVASHLECWRATVCGAVAVFCALEEVAGHGLESWPCVDYVSQPVLNFIVKMQEVRREFQTGD